MFFVTTTTNKPHMTSLIDFLSGKRCATSMWGTAPCVFCDVLTCFARFVIGGEKDVTFLDGVRYAVDDKNYVVCEECVPKMESLGYHRCDACASGTLHPIAEMTKHVVPEEGDFVIFVCKQQNERHDEGRGYSSA